MGQGDQDRYVLVSSVDDAFQTMALVEDCFEANALPGVPVASD